MSLLSIFGAFSFSASLMNCIKDIKNIIKSIIKKEKIEGLTGKIWGILFTIWVFAAIISMWNMGPKITFH